MNMKAQFAQRWARLALIGGALATPLALAGPPEDTAQAEKEFARGDLLAAIALWTKAAEQGYAPAQARLGDILDKSEEDESAVEWYQKAAEQNNAAGLYGLGQMYVKGEGVKKDFVKARALLLRSAQLDYAPAIIALMEAAKAGGLGQPADAAEAASWEARLRKVSPGYLQDAPKVVASAKGKGHAKAADLIKGSK